MLIILVTQLLLVVNHVAKANNSLMSWYLLNSLRISLTTGPDGPLKFHPPLFNHFFFFWILLSSSAELTPTETPL